MRHFPPTSEHGTSPALGGRRVSWKHRLDRKFGYGHVEGCAEGRGGGDESELTDVVAQVNDQRGCAGDRFGRMAARDAGIAFDFFEQGEHVGVARSVRFASEAKHEMAAVFR